MAVHGRLESTFYVLLFLASGCLFAVLGPVVALGLGLAESGLAEGAWMLLFVAGWPLTLAVAGTTLLGSLVVLGFVSWRQRLRVVTWYATVGVFIWLAEYTRPLNVLVAASVGAVGLTLLFGLVSYWLLRANTMVALWTFEITSLTLALLALLILAIEPAWWVGALTGMAFFGLCTFRFATMMISQRRSRWAVRP